MQVQQGNWITRARKAAGGKGPAQVDLLDDVNQMVQVDDLSTWKFDALGGVKQMVMPFSGGAVAAQISSCSIFNPPGSGLLGFVDYVELYANTASLLCTEIITTADPTTLSTVFTPYHADQRFGTAILSVGDISSFICRVGTLATQVPGNVTGRVLALLNAQSQYPRRFVLPPGSGYAISGNVVNTAFTGNIYWSERPAESGELTPS